MNDLDLYLLYKFAEARNEAPEYSIVGRALTSPMLTAGMGMLRALSTLGILRNIPLRAFESELSPRAFKAVKILRSWPGLAIASALGGAAGFSIGSFIRWLYRNALEHSLNKQLELPSRYYWI